MLWICLFAISIYAWIKYLLKFLLLLSSCSCLVMYDSLWPHGLQHTRLPCPSPPPRNCSNSCPLSQWCHPTTSSPSPPTFSISQHQGLFQWVFTSGGPSIGASVSASVLPMNIQGWFPLGLTGLISLQSKGLSRVFSSTTIWRHKFFWTQPFSLSSSHICTWLLEKP